VEELWGRRKKKSETEHAHYRTRCESVNITVAPVDDQYGSIVGVTTIRCGVGKGAERSEEDGRAEQQ